MMKQDYLCIGIPEELKQYSKVLAMTDDEVLPQEESCPNFGIQLVKDDAGGTIYAAYYSDSGELLKKIYYEGSSVSSIEHYRYNLLCSREKYIGGLLTEKIKYDRNGNIKCTINYEYNRKNQITAIRKRSDKSNYKVEYGYDELMRVNSRNISINNKVVTNQQYRYDILDRVVEYKDENQLINVQKLNQKNELLSYTIADKLGNLISILNKFLCSEYIGTEIDLNGHKTTVNDKSYTDNVMLKKPYTNEDDLDLVILKMFRSTHFNQNYIPRVHREQNPDVISSIIIDNVCHRNEPLPISMRKLRLLQK